MSKWFRKTSNVDAKASLICFPFAGGAAQIFDAWQAHLPQFQVIAVQYPGRMERLFEPGIGDLKVLIAQVIEQLDHASLQARPYYIYGHSNGALAALEFCRQLAQRGLAMPDHVFLAARKVPDTSSRKRYLLPDDELIEELRALNGTDNELLNNPEFMALVLPQLRADFQLGDTYQPALTAPLELNATCVIGSEDSIDEQQARDWQQFFTSKIGVKTIEGGHFFLNENRQALLQWLERHIHQVQSKSLSCAS